MLKALVPRVRCARCQGALEAHAFREGSDDHIQDGVLKCRECGRWYPIEEDVLVLTVPELQDPARHSRFCSRFQEDIGSLGLGNDETVFANGKSSSYAAQLTQREHSDWFAANPDLTYSDYARTPFWRAVDELTFRRWAALPEEGDWVLDVGCANGRSTFRLARPGLTVVGFDISEVMVRDAVRTANSRGLHAWTSFLVADADALPFADEQFNCAMSYGVLHHLPNPTGSCAEIHRILKGNGLFLASENNDSFLRPVFDWLMRILPLWNEKAGAEPLISEGKVKAWHAGLHVSIRLWYRVYLPPHVFDAVGFRASCWLMRATDSICNFLPWFRKAAGLIFWEIRKAHSQDTSTKGKE